MSVHFAGNGWTAQYKIDLDGTVYADIYDNRDNEVIKHKCFSSFYELREWLDQQKIVKGGINYQKD